uniref:DUF155 domain-containing protein n=1 Tax=Steinernema glaseri TaxID=37863 RepID=A0A1I7XZV6_9BILA
MTTVPAPDRRLERRRGALRPDARHREHLHHCGTAAATARRHRMRRGIYRTPRGLPCHAHLVQFGGEERREHERGVRLQEAHSATADPNLSAPTLTHYYTSSLYLVPTKKDNAEGYWYHLPGTYVIFTAEYPNAYLDKALLFHDSHVWHFNSALRNKKSPRALEKLVKEAEDIGKKLSKSEDDEYRNDMV